MATIVLHSFGDTIGYKNGNWKEIKYINQNMTIEILYDFLSHGGINQINIDNWILSNISLFHMGIAHALIDNDNIIDDIKNYFISIYNGIMFDSKKGKNRNIGFTMKKYIQKFQISMLEVIILIFYLVEMLVQLDHLV